MKPKMNDELVMSSEIIHYLVKRFLLKSDAVIPFAMLHLLQEVTKIFSVLWGQIVNLHWKYWSLYFLHLGILN